MSIALRLTVLKYIIISFFLLAAAVLIKPVKAVDSTSSTAPKRVEKVQQRIETRKDKIETRVASKEAKMTERVDQMKAKMASREAAFKAKLEAFKDKRKAQVAERVNTNLNKINQNQTSEMLKHLERMSSLLDKLEGRVNKGSSDIKDSQAAKAAIGSARTTISTTTAAVTAQAGKDYTINVTSESKIKADVQGVRNQLKTDLQAVRKQVIDAKQSVSNAVRIARGQPKEGTASGKQ